MEVQPLTDPAPSTIWPADDARRAHYEQSAVFMDTVVTIRVPRPPSTRRCAEDVGRAFAWFQKVERRCTRFNPGSELMRACAQVGTPCAVSEVLFEAVQFALAVAEASGGAFDPTVGGALEEAGFDRNFRTGMTHRHEPPDGRRPTYRDIRLDPDRATIEVRKPLVLDLGAVAKGLAIDLAAQELAAYADFVVEAGGDMVARGRNDSGEPWRVGIRHPDDPTVLIDAIEVSGAAVCTSGGYERVRERGAGHHILEPRTGRSPAETRSVTVVEDTAMAADAMATAAFVLGPVAGRAFLERHDAEGLFISPSGRHAATAGWRRDWK